jgi:hypothetical protein
MRDLSYRSLAAMEADVSPENWREERDRLVQLLRANESGEVTHIDEDGLRQLQATTPET